MGDDAMNGDRCNEPNGNRGTNGNGDDNEPNGNRGINGNGDDNEPNGNRGTSVETQNFASLHHHHHHHHHHHNHHNHDHHQNHNYHHNNIIIIKTNPTDPIKKQNCFTIIEIEN